MSADIRPARPQDADWIARVHVQAWTETYAGLLPAADIAARTVADRRRLWSDALAAGRSRIAVAPEVGFAAAGPQREAARAAEGWTDELLAIYVLRDWQGKGIGRGLLRAVCGSAAFTAWVVAGNVRAARVYAASGGRVIATRTEGVAAAAVTEHLFGWQGLHLGG
jgi:GNAT superfamily N-acetyltransferase